MIIELIKQLDKKFSGELDVIRSEIKEFKQATKEEFGAVRSEMSEFKQTVKDEFASVRAEMSEFKQSTKDEFASVRTEMSEFKQEIREDLKELKYDFRLDQEKLQKVYDERGQIKITWGWQWGAVCLHGPRCRSAPRFGTSKLSLRIQ